MLAAQDEPAVQIFERLVEIEKELTIAEREHMNAMGEISKSTPWAVARYAERSRSSYVDHG